MAAPQERNQDATVYVGDLDPQVNEALVWELMLQAGPVGMCGFFSLGSLCISNDFHFLLLFSQRSYSQG